MEDLLCEVSEVYECCERKDGWFANFVGQSGGLDD